MGHLLFAVSVISIHLNALLEFHSFGELSHNFPKFDEIVEIRRFILWPMLLGYGSSAQFIIRCCCFLIIFFFFSFSVSMERILSEGMNFIYKRWARYKMIIKRLSFSFWLLDEMMRPLCYNALGRMMKVNNCLSIF